MTELEELKFHDQVHKCMRWALQDIIHRVENLYNKQPFFDEILRTIRRIDNEAVLGVLPVKLQAVIFTRKMPEARKALALLDESEQRFRIQLDGNGFWLIEDKFNRALKVQEWFEQ